MREEEELVGPCSSPMPCVSCSAPSVPDPGISWWSPHSAYSLSLSLTALPSQRLACLDRKALQPAAYNNKLTLVTVREFVALKLCPRG